MSSEAQDETPATSETAEGEANASPPEAGGDEGHPDTTETKILRVPGAAPEAGARPPQGDFDPFAGDDDFDTLGFDSSFGSDPSAGASIFNTTFGMEPQVNLGDDDDTPPGGTLLGEGVVALDASAIGRALAEADSVDGRPPHETPDFLALQKGLIGIDLGASVAVVACFDDDGRHQIVPNEKDELATPVQIFFDEDGERLIGVEARQMAPSAPQRAVMNLKEVLNNPDFKVMGSAAGSDMSAEDVLNVMLERLIHNAEEHSGAKPTHLSLAAPAWFGEEQREVLRRAAERTGIKVVGVADEGLAAAVPYSLRLNDLNPRIALVFDMGHETLGVALVRCASGDIQVLAQQSSRELGSRQWNLLLAREAARKFKQAHDIDLMENPTYAMDLELRAEDAKRQLSRRAQTTLVAMGAEKTLKIGFTRRGFVEAAKGLLEKSLELVLEVRAAAELDSWERVDALIITGGGSRIPVIRKALSKETGLDPERGINPEEGVAVGALYWGLGERHRLEH